MSGTIYDRPDRYLLTPLIMPTPVLDFDALAQDFTRRTVLCIGDIMLDEFVYGEVSRISPEAPTPVIARPAQRNPLSAVQGTSRAISPPSARAASLSASSATILRGQADRCRACGPGRASKTLLVLRPSRPTTRKVRFVFQHFSTHMLRADWEQASACFRFTRDQADRGPSCRRSRARTSCCCLTMPRVC